MINVGLNLLCIAGRRPVYVCYIQLILPLLMLIHGTGSRHVVGQGTTSWGL